MAVLSVRKNCLGLRCGLLGLVDWVMFVLFEMRLFQYVQHMYLYVCGGVKRHQDKLHVSIK